MIFEEYAIAILKPDAVEQGYAKTIKNYFHKAELKIINEKSILLTPNNLQGLMLHPTKAYVNYMTRIPITILLLRGIEAQTKIYYLKKEIRAIYGKEGKMENLLHTADQGNEYHLSLKRFFPHLNQEKYCNHVDQNIQINSKQLPQLEDKLKQIDFYSNLYFIALNVPPQYVTYVNKTFINKKRRKIEIALATEFAIKNNPNVPTLITYLKKDKIINFKENWIEDNEEINSLKCKGHILLYLNNFKFKESDLLRYKEIITECKLTGNTEKRDHDIVNEQPFKLIKLLFNGTLSGIHCFRPDFSLLEVEYRMEIARLLRISRGGGSAGLCKPGNFSVSINCYSSSPNFQSFFN